MSAYVYLTGDCVVSRLPCILYSVIVQNDGANEGVVDIYDGQGVEAAYKVARLMCSTQSAKQFHWKGLELTRGLYVDIVERAECVTVEWEPVGYPEREKSINEYATVAAP